MSFPPPDTLALTEELTARLRTRRFGRSVRGYHRTGSTNTVAASWAAQGAPEGGVVLAEYQTAGRGRQGRTWQALAGQNLTFSVILRPSLPVSRLSLIPLAASVAVAEAIEHAVAPLRAAVRWPNDVLLEGRKCCGMLLESTLGGGSGATVILGIGLNVNQDAFPDELADRATSLLLQAGRPVSRAPLLAYLLQRLEIRYEALGTAEEAAVREACTARLHGLGQPMTLRHAGREDTVSGTFLGITDAGALRLQTDAGVLTFHAGEVTSHLEHRN